jgi:general secretion pathway protein D
MKIVADPSNNALIIMAKAQDYRDIETVIKQLDIMPLQVLIDATIVEVGLTDQLKYGLQWYFSHDLGGTTGSAGFLGSTLGLASAAGGFTYVLTNVARDMKIQLDALAATNKINVLSSPSLMVLNNQQATIKVGDQVPILTAQALPANGVSNLVGTQSIQYKDTGVLLEVRPRVNAGGLVSMELSQAVDTLKNAGAASASGINSPTIQQRKIQSQVAVRSGETIVLGGLIIENANNTVTGMPLLSELPWLGPLFSSTEKNLARTELVILMTPRVVENSRSSQQITNEYRRRLSGLYDPKPSPSPIIMEQGTGFNAPRINPE